MSATPSVCPSCGGRLHPVKFVCRSCETSVSGNFAGCPFCSLDETGRNMLELFLIARGNLKSVQRMLGVSYPTARARIEEMFNALEDRMIHDTEPAVVLEKLHRGEISVEDAISSLAD